MIIEGKVFEVYGNNVAAEQIVHTRHVKELSPQGLMEACMKDIDEDFHKKLETGKIMVAGSNFGCNSSREWAPAGLQYSGVELIIAKSFSRIFYRNAINIGLPILECGDADVAIHKGETLKVDLSKGVVYNLTKGAATEGVRLPDFLLDIMSGGGLLSILEKEGAN